MPIRSVQENPGLAVKGTIGLGVRQVSQSGNEYPTTVEHFVLDDAPDVKKIYGEDPQELDIFFPGEDIDRVIPTWLKYWSASLKDRNNPKKVVAGKLLCIGDGPSADGLPGTAIWRDRNREPPRDEIIEGRDASGYIKRACHGQNCVDWRDAKGNPKCKQTMQVFCILPRVSMTDIYRIDTSSWHSIRSFNDLLSQIKRLGGRISFKPFRIYRQEMATNYWDHKENKEKNGRQFIMKLKELNAEDFLQLHGKQIDDQMKKLQQTPFRYALPTSDAAMEMPMKELYPALEAAQIEQQAETEKKLMTVEDLLRDPDIVAKFDEYEKAIRRKFNPKDRMILVRRKEKEPGFGKEMILKAMQDGIDQMASKAGTSVEELPPPAVAGPAEAGAEAAPPPAAPPTDDDGIM